MKWPKRSGKIVGHLPEDHDWYDLIEPGVRNIVKTLRNNGFNTIMSCEHTMSVAIDLDPRSNMYFGDEIIRLHKLLLKCGHTQFTVGFYWDAACSPFVRVDFPEIDKTGPRILDDGTLVGGR